MVKATQDRRSLRAHKLKIPVRAVFAVQFVVLLICYVFLFVVFVLRKNLTSVRPMRRSPSQARKAAATLNKNMQQGGKYLNVHGNSTPRGGKPQPTKSDLAAGTASHSTKVFLKACKPRNCCVALGGISWFVLGYIAEHEDWKEAYKPLPFIVLSDKHRHFSKQCQASRLSVIQGSSSYLGYMQVDYGYCGASINHKRASGKGKNNSEASELVVFHPTKGALDDTDRAQ